MTEQQNKETLKNKLLQKYLDNKDYQAKFLLDPDIQSDEDFAHLDKNLAITNLMHSHREKINEPEEARSILRGLHILTNLKHYKEIKTVELAGYKEIKEKDKILQIPVYRQINKKITRFPKTFHALKADFHSFINTRAARKGHRMNAAISNRIVKEESITDKTDVKSRWGGIGKRQY